MIEIKAKRLLSSDKYVEVIVSDNNVSIDLGVLDKEERFALADALQDGIDKVFQQFYGEREEWENM